VLLAHNYPTHPLARYLLGALTIGRASSAENITISLAFLINWAFVMVGSFIRWSCYRALGRHFTFEVALRKGHQLVTQGPYSVVRHPSYSGGSLVMLGISYIAVGPGSWFWECGIWGTAWGKVIAIVSVGLRVYTLYSLIKRTPMEDEMLRRAFGGQWDEWAERVPWKWVPGIY